MRACARPCLRVRVRACACVWESACVRARVGAPGRALLQIGAAAGSAPVSRKEHGPMRTIDIPFLNRRTSGPVPQRPSVTS
jgi:hypothetical protein